MHETVWGGNRLCEYKGIEAHNEPVGESWEVSAVPSSVNIVANGKYKGKDLVSLINISPESILGKSVCEKYDVIPVGSNTKLIDAFIDNSK